MAACRVIEDFIDLRPSLRVTERTCSFDKLRMTSSALPNRTELNTSGDSWDLLNRMLTYKPHSSSDAITYTYRADGQRTKKVDDYASPSEETLFYYDGQMGVQDTHDDGTDVTVTKYGVGARGIDVITRKVNSGSETFAYPVYDTHGNMVATLARASSNSFTIGNEKSYDVWGGTRSGSSSVDQGYVANLGHRADAESDLTYMRARYYEPSTGRFISQDPGMAGFNWFVYCSNLPTCNIDKNGEQDEWAGATKNIAAWIMGFVGLIGVMITACVDRVAALVVLGGVLFMASWFFSVRDVVLGGFDVDSRGSLAGRFILGSFSTVMWGALSCLVGGALLRMGDATIPNKAVAVIMAHVSNISMFLFLESVASGYGP